MLKNGYACPCCGCLTLLEKPPGSHEICSVCGWEDDNVQYDDRNYEGGANDVSLNQAIENYKNFGAHDKKFLKYARMPRPDEIYVEKK